MTAKGKRSGARYSPEQGQEDRSEGQIKERFAELRWPCDRLGRDLGEDLSIRIYDEGASTGLSFLVQLKSAADAEKRKRKKSPALAYDLEVKDLIHWEVSTTLVVLVVWDVTKRRGWWQPIGEILEELDKKNKGWRKKKKVAVTVPLANGTDGDGLRRLRWVVADHSLPMVQRSGEMTINLSFPSTETGLAANNALERVLDYGETAVIAGEFITEIEEPQWMRRLYGGRHLAADTIRVSAATTTQSFPVRVEVESGSGTATLPYIDLRIASRGRKRLVLTNEHQGTPVRLTLLVAMPEGKNEGTFAIEQCVPNVYEALDAATFELALRAKDARVRILDLATGATLWEADREGSDDDLARLHARREVLDKLCFVQRRIASQGTLSLAGGVTPDDLAALERIFAVLSSGKWRAKSSLRVKVPPVISPVVRTQLARGENVELCFDVAQAKPIKLLNIDVALGKIRIVPDESSALAGGYARCAREAARTGRAVDLEAPDLPVTLEYLEWIPAEARWERLASLAEKQEGYVTLAQARWVGYSDDVFLAFIQSCQIERVASDVFRLVHFPRADHEELVSLWLQTDGKGVLSHDTALLLHELSDILPTRRHVTVPPGWMPPEGRVFNGDVVLHHAEVPEDELSWIGPVPFTVPLRTVRDSIADDVSPDLVEQAIAEGLSRRLFRAEDLPPSLRAESA